MEIRKGGAAAVLVVALVAPHAERIEAASCEEAEGVRSCRVDPVVPPDFHHEAAEEPDHRGSTGIVENRPQQAPPYYDDAWHFDDVLVDEPEETMAAFVSGVGRHFGY